MSRSLKNLKYEHAYQLVTGRPWEVTVAEKTTLEKALRIARSEFGSVYFKTSLGWRPEVGFFTARHEANINWNSPFYIHSAQRKTVIKSSETIIHKRALLTEDECYAPADMHPLVREKAYTKGHLDMNKLRKNSLKLFYDPETDVYTFYSFYVLTDWDSGEKEVYVRAFTAYSPEITLYNTHYDDEPLEEEKKLQIDKILKTNSSKSYKKLLHHKERTKLRAELHDAVRMANSDTFSDDEIDVFTTVKNDAGWLLYY